MRENEPRSELKPDNHTAAAEATTTLAMDEAEAATSSPDTRQPVRPRHPYNLRPRPKKKGAPQVEKPSYKFPLTLTSTTVTRRFRCSRGRLRWPRRQKGQQQEQQQRGRSRYRRPLPRRHRHLHRQDCRRCQHQCAKSVQCSPAPAATEVEMMVVDFVDDGVYCGGGSSSSNNSSVNAQ